MMNGNGHTATGNGRSAPRPSGCFCAVRSVQKQGATRWDVVCSDCPIIPDPAGVNLRLISSNQRYTMTEESKEPWLNRMALATVILAVCATLSTFKAGGYSTQSVISQAQASDQWAFYQAKSTKQHLYEVQAEQLSLQAQALGAENPARVAYARKEADYRAAIGRYAGEKQVIQTRARELELQRDVAKLHGKPFGIAVIFLQVSILLNSIAGLMKARRIWWTAIPVGVAGLACFADGFLMLV